MKVLGVSFGTLALVVGIAVLVRMFGSKVPLLNQVQAA
jgi:hypothetical protein